MILDAVQFNREIVPGVVRGTLRHRHVGVQKPQGKIVPALQFHHRDFRVGVRPESLVEDVVEREGVAVHQEFLEGLHGFLAGDLQGGRRGVDGGRRRSFAVPGQGKIVALKQKNIGLGSALVGLEKPLDIAHVAVQLPGEGQVVGVDAVVPLELVAQDIGLGAAAPGHDGIPHQEHLLAGVIGVVPVAQGIRAVLDQPGLGNGRPGSAVDGHQVAERDEHLAVPLGFIDAVPQVVIEGGQHVVGGAVEVAGAEKSEDNFQEDQGHQEAACHRQQVQAQLAPALGLYVGHGAV